MPESWDSFVGAVKHLLTTDGDLIGAQQAIDQLIRSAVIDLQRNIPQLRESHSVRFGPSDVVDEGNASFGSLEFGLKPTEWWLIETDLDADPSHCDRIRLEYYPWERRHELACCDHIASYYTLGKDGMSFVTYPKVSDGKHLLVQAAGIKRTFKGSDTVFFPEECRTAVYYYVRGHILLDYEDNSRGIVFYNENPRAHGLFQQTRRQIYTDMQE